MSHGLLGAALLLGGIMSTSASMNGGRSLALLTLVKGKVNQDLVRALEDQWVSVGQNTGWQVIRSASFVDSTAGSLPELLAQCQGPRLLPCLGDKAASVQAQALSVVRVLPSKLVSSGIVVQYMVVTPSGHGVERKGDMELASYDDVVASVRANYLTLFGVPWPNDVLTASDSPTNSTAAAGEAAVRRAFPWSPPGQPRFHDFMEMQRALDGIEALLNEANYLVSQFDPRAAPQSTRRGPSIIAENPFAAYGDEAWCY